MLVLVTMEAGAGMNEDGWDLLGSMPKSQHSF
jgi:hypothetical protein